VPDKSSTVTTVLLLMVFGLLVYPVLKLQWVRNRGSRRSVFALLLLAVAIGGFGWMVWPQKKYLDFTDDQQQRFVASLRETQPNKRVVLGCSANEEICASVGRLLELFHNANWKVRGDAVERGVLGKPQFGIIILASGSGTIPDPDNPTYGLWTPVINPERDALIRAFKVVGITLGKTMADPKLSQSEIALIFGPQPPNP